MTNSTHQQDEHQSSSKSSSRRITLAHQNPQCVPTVTPSKNNEMSQDEFEASVTRVQLRMGSQLKEMMKRRQIVEKEIEALQTEMEESLFFHELGDDEDNDAVHMDAEPFDEKRNDLTCTLASFEYTAAALSKAQETNKTLANEIKLSEKRRTIAQHKIDLAELNEKDFQSRTASLEQIVSLYSKRLASVEQQRKQLENDLQMISNDRDQTNHKLQDAASIVAESVNHIESLQAKVHETETTLKKTQQMYSKASEEAKAAKSSVRALRSSLYAAETTRINELESLRNQLNNALNENKTLKASIRSIEASASQHVQELSDKISHLESATNLPELTKKEKYSPLSNRVTPKLQNQLPRFSPDSQSQSSEEQAIVEFKTCLDVVYSQLTAAETLVTVERQNSEALQECLTSAKQKHSSEVARLHHELMISRREQLCLAQAMKFMQSSFLHHFNNLFEGIEQTEKDTEEAANRLESRIESLSRQLSSITMTSNFKDVKGLVSSLEKLQGECAALESDKRSIANSLQVCRKALLEKDDYISLLESECSLHQNRGEMSFPVTSLEFNEQIPVANQSDENVQNLMFHTNLNNQPQPEKSMTEAVSNMPFAGPETKILMLQKSNKYLMQELTNKDDIINKLISIRDGLERDLKSVKSVLDVAQNEVYLFCEMLLQSQSEVLHITY